MPVPPPQPSPRPGGRGNRIINQFSGMAGLGCLIGAATVIFPLVFHWGFYVLPIAGFIAGIYAIQRGQQIGGTVAVVLSATGGILTLLGLRS